jgi:PAS domain S-box-containing protein
MSLTDTIKPPDSTLRAAAEAQLAIAPIAEASARSIDEVLHELQVHQIELEMQNEALRHAQIALEESRDRYIDLYEFAPVGYLSVTPDGMIAGINLTGASLLGKERKSLLQRRFAAFVIPEDQERWTRHFLTVKNGGANDGIELALRRGDGAVFHAWLYCVLQKTGATAAESGPGADELRIVLSDITARKQSEQKLLQSEEMYRRLAEDMPAFMTTFLPDGKLSFVNPALAAIVASSQTDLLGKNFFDFLCGEEREIVRAKLARLTPEQPVETHEQTFQRPGGRLAYQQWTNRAFFDAAGSLTHLQAIGEDITERKLAEVELLRSNAELEQFSYAISHDMRQPLRMIASYMQLLETELAGRIDAEQRESFFFAIDGAKRLDTMMTGLLDYSRVGRVGVPPEWLDSRTLLDDVLHFFQFAAADAHAAIAVAGDWPRLYASRDEMMRLMQNLLSNAIKFRVAGRPPEITLTGRMDGKAWRMIVSDNGVGVMPDQIGRLFQMFQRLHTRDKYEGTGIGLALCRKIAEHHGGSIWVESAGLDQGCRFFLALPEGRVGELATS